MGYKTLTVTDHGTVSSWVKFSKACKDNGIKPILGIEAYFCEDRHIKEGGRNSYHQILLAKTDEGVRNIGRLCELSYREGFYYNPRIDWELLQKYGEGVVCTSACVAGIIPTLYDQKGYESAKEWAKKFKDLFKADFYLEVQYHNLEEEEKCYAGVIQLAKELEINVVGTNDVHYLKKDDCSIQEVMQTARTGKCIKDPSRMRHTQNQLYLKSPEEMADLFGGKYGMITQTTLEIADKCNGALTFGKVQLPSIDIPKEYKSDMDYLDEKSRAGLKALGKHTDPVYVERLNHELSVIRNLREKGMMFDRYFLIVSDYVNWAWDHGIRVGVGRGSGAGSLVLYCLNVTGIDPLKYDLLFERFLAEDRNEMPDIDIDFQHDRRDEVFEYVCSKYGVDHCAEIGTINTYQVAGAIKAAFRVFDPGNQWEKIEKQKLVVKQNKELAQKKQSKRTLIEEDSPDETVKMANIVSKMLPRAQNGKTPSEKLTLLKYVAEKDHERIYAYECPECGAELSNWKRKYPEIFAFAESIEGLVEKRGIHAAGVLITETPTVDSFPQQFSGKANDSKETSKRNKLATCYDMEDVEKLGGVKFDLLSVKVLTIIEQAHSEVVKKGKWKWDFTIDNIPDNDPDVLKIFSRGETVAIFQFESDGMRKTLKDLQPDCFENIIAANALYRPGPMKNIEKYINRKHGKEEIVYPANAAEPILKSTYGIMVYQEQVMSMTKVLAGFTGSEADRVRKAMGKKKKEILDAMKAKFADGCEKQETCSKEIVQNLWEQMEEFSEYAFNKAHACGYAFTAYQCAWLKHYFPEEFMAAQLSVEGYDGNYEQVDIFENECRAMGIKLLPINVNLSKPAYIVEGPKIIRRGFFGIKGIGNQSAEDLAKNQPYTDIFNFCMKAQDGCKHNVVEALIDNSGFDCFRDGLTKKYKRDANERMMMKEYEEMVERAKKEKKEQEKDNRPSMFSDEVSLGEEFQL